MRPAAKRKFVIELMMWTAASGGVEASIGGRNLPQQQNSNVTAVKRKRMASLAAETQHLHGGVAGRDAPALAFDSRTLHQISPVYNSRQPTEFRYFYFKLKHLRRPRKEASILLGRRS